MTPFSKLLIANRGEIAVRIIRTAHALGYRTVAVYSEADAGAPHVRLADQAILIGPAPSRESYLDMDRLLDAARETGADALHPGYGFLAENGDLAERCAAAGITFVGPPAEAIRLMGDKARAKRRMRQADVPVIPGFEGDSPDQGTLETEGEKLGFPLLIKAVAGGGGRGMRIARARDELPALLESARAEASSAFGDGALLLERLIEGGRHVELQVFADHHGRAVHLGERDCSTQRRHQKIIEESPSLAVSPELRERMGAAAVAAAKAIGYVGAGTVEFMLAGDGEFFFMEMNTRLQVEHPVTEMVTGLDLVAWQLETAAGAPLPLSQEELTFEGHAIEARIYAEDPFDGFLPQTGRVLVWRPDEATVGTGGGVRVDAGIVEGQEVSAFYDPMLAKIIAHGQDRETARRRLIRAIEDCVLLGPTTNRQLLLALLRDEVFVAGAMTTGHVDALLSGEHAPAPAGPAALHWSLAALLCSLPAGAPAPWRSAGHAAWPVTLRRGDLERRLSVTHEAGDRYLVETGAESVPVTLLERTEREVRFEVRGVQQRAWYAAPEPGCVQLEVRGERFVFQEPSADRAAAGGDGADGRLVAPISGQVMAVKVKVGDAVEKGDVLVLLEAMKMEHPIRAAADGVVEKISVAPGDQVTARKVVGVIRIAADAEPSKEE